MINFNIFIKKFVFISSVCMLLCSNSKAMEKNVQQDNVPTKINCDSSDTVVVKMTLDHIFNEINNIPLQPYTAKNTKIEHLLIEVENLSDNSAIILGIQCEIVNNRIEYIDKIGKDILGLNDGKYALFEIRTIDEYWNISNNKYYYCSDIGSFVDEGFESKGIFSNKSNIISIKVIASNTSHVTNICRMFLGCRSLLDIDLSSFNTINITSVWSMFYMCDSLLDLNISNFNTENVTNMSYMFYNCRNLLNLNLSNFNTDKVKDMNYMFYGCSSLQKLNLSNFNIDKVENMKDIFKGCFDVFIICTCSVIIHFYCQKVIDNRVDLKNIPGYNDHQKIYGFKCSNIGYGLCVISYDNV